MQLDRLPRDPPPIDARFREWLERVPGTVYVQQGDGTATTVYISPRVESLVGLPAETFTDDPDAWATLVHPEDQGRLHAADLAADHTGSFHCEYRLRTTDGTYRWMRDEAHRQTDRADLWIGVLVDITDQKRTEEELRAAVSRFQTLVEQVPAVIYTEALGDAVNPTYVSPRYESMFGFTPEERLADPTLWEKLVHPDDRARILAEIEELDSETDGWSFEYRMRHRDGHVVWVQDQAVVVYDEDGTRLFYQGVLSDVTESRRAKEELELALDELRRADEMKNTFLTAVSHDLRTPLATILGNAITLEHADELAISDAERTQMLRSLAAKARRLTELITDLLDMDRLTRGAFEPRFAPEELGGLVERVSRETDLIGEHAVELDLRPVVAMVDRSMIERVVDNLLVNASKHTPPHAAIRVRLRAVGQGAEIVVEDDGPGVPPELRDALFRPFERGPSANPQSPGVGLGLSLVSRFAELHGGRAWVEDATGGGAAFHVLLAASEPLS
ncbi:MAG TPA: PAS domain-containing protein [Actinomycetota bacterium]|nr:PAS domain-containing protein [Actinomycetota bacterium]